jgi:hypothetical protein
MPNSNAFGLYIVYMRYYLLLLLPVLWLAACNETPKATQANKASATVNDSSNTKNPEIITADKLIIPGKSIGQTAINENTANVFKRLGRPDGGDAAMGKSVSIWYANHDTTGYQTMIYSSRQMGTENEDSKVKQIRVTSPWFMTTDSIHTGSTLQQIKQHYQVKKATYCNRESQQYITYGTPQGIAFETDPQEKCVAVIVYEADNKAQSEFSNPFASNLFIAYR